MQSSCLIAGIKMPALIFLTAVWALFISIVLGAESIQVEDVSVSSQGKVHVKGSQPKQKTGKRHGYFYAYNFLYLVAIILYGNAPQILPRPRVNFYME